MGINRRKIFFNEADHDDFLDRLGSILPDCKTPCFFGIFDKSPSLILELVHYIHLNPLRAGIVAELKLLDTLAADIENLGKKQTLVFRMPVIY